MFFFKKIVLRLRRSLWHAERRKEHQNGSADGAVVRARVEANNFDSALIDEVERADVNRDLFE